MSWTLKIRTGPNTQRVRHPTLDAALDDLEGRLGSLSAGAHRDDVHFIRREIPAALQVGARAEIAGPQRLFPSVRGGIDLRGDGSSEAYSGGVRRRLIEPRRRERPIDALRRELQDQA